MQQAIHQSCMLRVVRDIKHSFRLSYPLTLSFFVQELTPFAFIFMLARLGTEMLAASILAWSIYILFSVWFSGICGSVSALTAQKYGAKDQNGVGLVVSQGFILAALLSPIVVLGLWFAPYLLYFSHQSSTIIQMSTHYLHVLTLFIVPFGFLIVVEQFLIGINKTRLVLKVSLVQIPVEIFLNYCFIFGKFGLPTLGILSLGYSRLIVFSVASLILVFFLKQHKDTRNYPIFSYIHRLDLKIFLDLFRIGFPIGFTYVIELGGMAVLTFFMAQFGSIQLAAHQIVWQVWEITDGVLFAVSQVTTATVGQSFGRRDHLGIKLSTYINIGIGLLFLVMLIFFYIGFWKNLVLWGIGKEIGHYPQIVYYSTTFLLVIVVLQLFDNVRLNILGALRGLKDTKMPMLVSMISFWFIGLGIGYVLSFIFHLGGLGLWIGLAIGIMVNTIILFKRYQYVLSYLFRCHARNESALAIKGESRDSPL